MVRKTALRGEVRKNGAPKLETVLRREIGRNAPSLICDLTASSVTAALEEFVANAYDADATRVVITYEPENNLFVIQDNGTGMDFEGLRSFYRLGDSPKIDNPITKKGRRCIGKFGIATILLNYLAKEYKLETVSGGTTFVVSEVFEKTVDAEKPLGYGSHSSNGKPSGTKITLKHLRFSEGEKFSLSDFVRKLQWEVPILPDFAISVNGTTIESKAIIDAETYHFEKTGFLMGRVEGFLYYTKRPTVNAGVHIYVNGRQVGDPTLFESKLGKRLVGIIHANGIESAILFDRGRFREDHPGYVELVETVKSALGKVEYDVRRTNNKMRLATAEEKAGEIIKGVCGLFTKTFPPALRGDNQFEGKLMARGSQERSLEYDPNEGVFTFNRDNLLFGITGVFDPQTYRAYIIHGALDELTRALVGTGASMDSFLHKKNELLGYLCASGRLVEISDNLLEGTTVDIPFYEMRMYEPAEIAQITRRPIGIFRKLIESGGLPQVDGKARGDHVTNLMRMIGGYTSLCEMLQGSDHDTNISQAYVIATAQLGCYNSGIPFLINLGKTSNCFFIKDEFVEAVKKCIDDDELDLRYKKEQNPLEALAHRYLTVPELAQHLGCDIQKTAEVIVYAQKEGLRLDNRNDGSIFRFDYFYAAQAAQKKFGAKK